MRAGEAEGGPKCINIVRAAHDNPDCCGASGTFGRRDSWGSAAAAATLFMISLVGERVRERSRNDRERERDLEASEEAVGGTEGCSAQTFTRELRLELCNRDGGRDLVRDGGCGVGFRGLWNRQ